MDNFYVLAHDSGRNDLETVSDYDLKNFDVTLLWNGDPLGCDLPDEVRLTVSRGVPSDYLANPLSWPIVSERLWKRISPLAANDCEIIRTHLCYDDSTPVEGYVLMNPTTLIAATADAEELSVPQLVVRKSMIPNSKHIFRLTESSTVIVVSSELVGRIEKIGLKGVAIVKVKTVP